MATLEIEANLQTILESSPPLKGDKVIKAHLVADVHCQLAECILYDDVNDTILWTDILGRRFHKLPLSGGDVVTRDLPAMLCAFALRPQDLPGHLCAWEDGFQLYDLDNGVPISEKSQGEDACPVKLPTRLNDGRVDAQGKRFICGGFYGGVAGKKMKVFKCEYNEDGKLCHEPILDEIEVTNSICFAPPDGSTMFFADSPTKKICAYDYDTETGNVSGKRLLHTVTAGVPDGSICDSEGFLWNAVWRDGAGPSMVNRIDPATGKVVFTVNMPDSTSQVSCCCLGGKDLDILFITTAAVATDITKEPHAGAIYAAKVGVKGMKEARFIGK
jgi:L-arabinonolactonase